MLHINTCNLTIRHICEMLEREKKNTLKIPQWKWRCVDDELKEWNTKKAETMILYHIHCEEICVICLCPARKTNQMRNNVYSVHRCNWSICADNIQRDHYFLCYCVCIDNAKIARFRKSLKKTRLHCIFFTSLAVHLSVRFWLIES